MYKLGYKEEPEIKLPTFTGSWKIQGSSKKTSTSVSSTTLKPLTVWITINCGKFLEMGIPGHFIYLLRNLYAGEEATEPDMEQQTGSKWGKEYEKAVHVHSAYITSI